MGPMGLMGVSVCRGICSARWVELRGQLPLDAEAIMPSLAVACSAGEDQEKGLGHSFSGFVSSVATSRLIPVHQKKRSGQVWAHLTGPIPSRPKRGFTLR